MVHAKVLGFDPSPIGGAVGFTQALSGPVADRTHVVLQREGQGRAYYRVGVQWTPIDAPARAQGVSVSRWMPAQIRVGEQGSGQP